MKKSKIVKLLENMCCSVCHHDFDEESLSVLYKENNLYILKIVCSECGKDFGLSLLNIGNNSNKEDDEALVFQECPVPIDYDEILDGHNFMDNLEKDWTKYIPDDFK